MIWYMLELGLRRGILFISKYYFQYSIFIISFLIILKFKCEYQVDTSILGGDLISWGLRTLTFWISGLIILTFPWGNTLIIIMIICLYTSFFSLNILNFYIIFELVIIPIYLLILMYGVQPERLISALYILFYTIIGSLPFLISLIIINNTNYIYAYLLDLNFRGISIIAFLVKLPLYGLHLWLPKAHVEAPVNGSIILAGILLKLGGYGIIRVIPLISLFKGFLINIGIWGGVISSLICLREIDIKKIVAYSSVHHMGLILSSIILGSTWGYSGGIIIIISHGLCSSGLFCIVNILYERLHTRSLILIKGMATLSPIFILWWFLIIIGNIGGPPFIGFISEVNLLLGIFSWWYNFILWILLFLSVAYSIHLFLIISHGEQYQILLTPLIRREFLLIFLHLAPALLLILKISLLI